MPKDKVKTYQDPINENSDNDENLEELKYKIPSNCCFCFCTMRRALIFAFFVFVVALLLKRPIEEHGPTVQNIYLKPFMETAPSFSKNATNAQQIARDICKENEGNPLCDVDDEKNGLKPPILLIPGYITSSLKIWRGMECSGAFGNYLWGGINMLTNIFFNIKCWVQHMMLDRETGLDPSHIRVRADDRYTSYVLPGYYVWGLLIENLAYYGYDMTNNMYLAIYDWRLSFRKLEQRDHYLTKLKEKIEQLKRLNNNQKVVIISHSLGTNLMYYFLQFVRNTIPDGDLWINDHIESIVNIAGPLLGAAKTYSTMISGEMKDTAMLGQLGQKYLLNQWFSPDLRCEIFRSWSSTLEMMPKGNAKLYDYNMVSFTNSSQHANVTMDDLIEFLQNYTDPYYAKLLKESSYGVADDFSDPKYREDPKYWSNPLTSQLPDAKDLTIYSFYGYQSETEVGYFYKDAESEHELISYELDFFVNDVYQNITNGCQIGPGDGTVPLQSLGFMPAKAWKTKKYNPSGVTIKTVELQHSPKLGWGEFRGGGKSAAHVDVMGSNELFRYIFQILSGKGHDIEERITSNIMDYDV